MTVTETLATSEALNVIVSNHQDENVQIRLKVTTANGPDQFWDDANRRKQRDILMEERAAICLLCHCTLVQH
jgi:hypothetical protein